MNAAVVHMAQETASGSRPLAPRAWVGWRSKRTSMRHRLDVSSWNVSFGIDDDGRAMRSFNLNFGSSELIATLALVASVVSLLIAWRTGRHSTKITTYRSATDLTLDIDHIFVEHPTFRKFFYESVDVTNEPDNTRAQVDSIAELMLDCFECIWDIRATYSPVDRGSWGQYVLDMMDTSPVMKHMFEHRIGQDWYPALEDLKRANERGRLEARTIRTLRYARRLWMISAPPQPAASSERRSDSA